VALAAAAGGVVGAYFMWKSRENQVASLEDAVAIQATKTKIAKAQAEAELLEQQSDALDPRVVELKKVITDSKRRVLELNKDAALNELSDADIARRFSESGL
jgi:Flp pilus assembly protein TadB